MRNENGRRNGDRRGNVMVVGLMFGVLLGFSALSVDLALVRLADTQLQASIDAAAMSGANELDGEATGIAAAKLRAQTVAAMNNVLGTGVTLTLSEVQVGTYDETDGSFTLYTGGSTSEVNAVRIDHTPPQVGSVLGAVAFGIAGYDINARSMGIRPVGGPAGGSRCYLPIAVPQCLVYSTPPGENPDPLQLIFQNVNTDNVGWGLMTTPVNAADLETQLSGQCDGVPLEVGEQMGTMEGGTTAVAHAIRDILNEDYPGVSPTSWDASMYGPIPTRIGAPPPFANSLLTSAVDIGRWGNVLQGPIALVGPSATSDMTTCSAGMSFNASTTWYVKGIAWGVVYDVRDSGANKNLWMQLDLINEHEIWGEVDEDGTGNVISKGDTQLINW